MTSYKSFVSLLADIEKSSEMHKNPEAESLIAKAREALRKDLLVQVMLGENTRESEDFTHNQMDS